jgi:hypothetical protein
MPMNPRLLVPRATFDADAAAYLRAVEAADGQALETPVKRAVDDFFKGTKADGIWDAIKASCILCGARTLAGALVPLVGSAPTNVADGFVSGDYTRGGATPGLKGDGTSYLDSGRADTADGQDDHHIASFSTFGDPNATKYQIGVQNGTGPSKNTVAGVNFYSRSNTPDGSVVAMTQGAYALSRNDGASFYFTRGSGAVQQALASSDPSTSGDTHYVFAFNVGGSAIAITTARIAFYSIGSSLGSDPATGLALLDARVTALVTAIGAAV